jgi:hypothetical protein
MGRYGTGVSFFLGIGATAGGSPWVEAPCMPDGPGIFQDSDHLVGGWALPLWKIWKSIGMMTFPMYGKIENVPNHRPVILLCKPVQSSVKFQPHWRDMWHVTRLQSWGFMPQNDSFHPSSVMCWFHSNSTCANHCKPMSTGWKRTSFLLHMCICRYTYIYKYIYIYIYIYIYFSLSLYASPSVVLCNNLFKFAMPKANHSSPTHWYFGYAGSPVLVPIIILQSLAPLDYGI